jgi:hypothetical protein
VPFAFIAAISASSTSASPMPWPSASTPAAAAMRAPSSDYGVSDDRNAGRVRPRDDGPQRRQIHAVEIGHSAVAPAVGEDLDNVRPVGEGAVHREVGGARRRRLHGEEVAPARARCRARRNADADREREVRRLTAPEPVISRIGRDHLARDREVDGSGDAVDEVRGIGLAEIVRARRGRGAQMRVEVVEAGQQGQAARFDDAGTRGRAGAGRPRRSARPHQHVVGPPAAGAVEDVGAADQEAARSAAPRRAQQRRRSAGELRPAHCSGSRLISVRSRNCSVARRLRASFRAEEAVPLVREDELAIGMRRAASSRREDTATARNRR